MLRDAIAREVVASSLRGVNTTGTNTNFGAVGTLFAGTTGGITLTSANLDFDLSGASTTPGGTTNDLISTGGIFTLTSDPAG